MAITAKTARCIRLDSKDFEVGALEFGEVRLACSDVPEALAQQGDVEKIAAYLVSLGHEPETALYEARNAKDFYGLGSDCLWITFARDHLWWAFANTQVIHVTNEFVHTGGRLRTAIGGWRNADVNGIPLRLENLSKKLIELSARPGTEPDVDTFDELLRVINGTGSAQRGVAQDRGILRGLGIMLSALVLTVPALAQIPGYKPNWQTVEADNGAIYKVDVNSISHYNNGTADVTVYFVEGSGFNPENTHRLWFDCRGHFRDQTNPPFGATQYAPPRSTAGRLSEIACAGAKDTRLEDASRPVPKDIPANYCKGFSPEACARITAAAETKPKPRYCKPGFALVGSGLSAEQLRICYVISNEEGQLEGIRTDRSEAPSTPRNYNMTLSATHNGFPYIIGSTDLPEGTKLLVSIKKPRLPNASELAASGRPMCEDNCRPATAPDGELSSTTVQSGAFAAGPFSWEGKPFWEGKFEVDVFLVSLPNEVFDTAEKLNEQRERMRKPILASPVAVNPER